MRKLKTPNALRDLPLRALLEPEELEKVLKSVEDARKKRGPRAVLFAKKAGKGTKSVSVRLSPLVETTQ